MLEEYESTKPPAVLDYGKTKPLGYRAIQKLTRFFPLTALPNTDMVRFIINSTGFWDPYSSYLRFTVRVTDPTTDPPYTTGTDAGNMIQLDHSASSLIQAMSFIQNGVEIERIDRYEVLASMLNDMFYSSEQRAQRVHEGFGRGMPSSISGIANVSVSKRSDVTSTATSLADTLLGTADCERSVAHGFGKTGAETQFMSAGSTPTALSIGASRLDFPRPYFDGVCEPTMWSSTNATVRNVSQYTFCIPIISGIFGVLMPADEIKYVPMQFFQNLEMNFRLNPYAFHSCNPTRGTRNFQVTACELFVNIIHFAPEINTSLAQIVKERGLYIHTCSYYYGPSHMIASAASMETYPINMSFKSLRSILWCFMPSVYRTRPYIRELRRKALNCTAAQVRIGGDLFPTFPIGNLGTGSSSGLPSTNADFLVNTYKAFGRLHDTVNDSLVTSHTFCTGGNYIGTGPSPDGTVTIDFFNNTPAVGTGSTIHNALCWPDLVRGFVLNNESTTGGFESKDQDGALTAGSYTNYFMHNSANSCYLENQFVPRAVFGIDLDTITTDDSVISGVNTLINKPFELILEGTNPGTEACELNIFLYYDLVIMIDRDFTVKYLGRGG